MAVPIIPSYEERLNEVQKTGVVRRYDVGATEDEIGFWDVEADFLEMDLAEAWRAEKDRLCAEMKARPVVTVEDFLSVAFLGGFTLELLKKTRKEFEDFVVHLLQLEAQDLVPVRPPKDTVPLPFSTTPGSYLGAVKKNEQPLVFSTEAWGWLCAAVLRLTTPGASLVADLT